MSQAQAVSGAPAVRASDAERDQAAEILRAGYTEGRLSRALAELEAAELVHAANGAVSVVYPFSGAPTRQQVELDGFPAVYAMCAIDALGIPAMAGRGSGPPRSTASPAPIVVPVRGGQWRWTRATAIVVFGSTRDCGTDCES